MVADDDVGLAGSYVLNTRHLNRPTVDAGENPRQSAKPAACAQPKAAGVKQRRYAEQGNPKEDGDSAGKPNPN